MNLTRTTLWIALGTLLSLPAAATEREHDAHEHGAGRLNLVLDGNELAIELLSPAANLVGFEHAPRDAEEREALERAVERLHAGSDLFGLPAAAGCRLLEAEVDDPLAEHGEHHEGDTEHEEHEHEEHADLTAHYHFECAHPGDIEHIEVHLFAAFPGTERLSVQYVAAGGQGATELTAEHTRLRLR